MKPDKREPRMIPNPRYCERCDGRGYLVADAEWEPIAVQCPDCKHGEVSIKTKIS